MENISKGAPQARIDVINRWKSIRTENNLTVEELAEFLDVSPSTLRRWETFNGTTAASSHHTRWVCAKYDISPAWLLAGVGPRSMSNLEAKLVIAETAVSSERLAEAGALAERAVENLHLRIRGVINGTDPVACLLTKLEEMEEEN